MHKIHTSIEHLKSIEMKTTKLISMSLIFGLFITLSSSRYEQNPVTTDQKMYKKIHVNNDKVRVIKVEIASGEMVPLHSLPGHVVYTETSGTLEITGKEKVPVTVEFKAGDATYFLAATQMIKNIGKNTFKMIVTEMKIVYIKKTKMIALPAKTKPTNYITFNE